jgi:hypothetical protein
MMSDIAKINGIQTFVSKKRWRKDRFLLSICMYRGLKPVMTNVKVYWRLKLAL